MMNIAKTFHRVANAVIYPIVSELDRLIRIGNSQHDLLLRSEWRAYVTSAKNPLNKCGRKYFSQADEDGITLEILRRIGARSGTFAEIGVGNGLENNTLILLAAGWRGFWIGAEELAFDHTLDPCRLTFIKSWVSLDNLKQVIQRGMMSIKANHIDVVSLDVDGNEYYFAKAILAEGILPKLFIVEYNGKFPPPIRWSIEYDPNHQWDLTDYQGASLSLLADLLREFSYSLVCCNGQTGVNAFFVRNEFMAKFADIPREIEDIFVECRYQVYQKWGHPASAKTIEQILRRGWESSGGTT